MRQLLAALLVPALITASGFVSPLHVHEHGDHDHPEHHAGPASHVHAPARPNHDDDGRAHLDGCDPGRHAVAFNFISGVPSQHIAQPAEASRPAAVTPDLVIERSIRHHEVRAHGPPRRGCCPPRAPPVTDHD